MSNKSTARATAGQRTKRPAFVSASIVAARLTKVATVAKDITLSAKNAKAVVVRGGEGARVFLPITDYIEQLADQAIHSARVIESDAVELSRLAVRETRARDAEHRLEVALTLADHAVHRDGIAGAMKNSQRILQKLREQYATQTRLLELRLEDALAMVRPARFISVNSRVEAARDRGAYQALEVVADRLEKSADRIQEEVHHCQDLLKDIAMDGDDT